MADAKEITKAVNEVLAGIGSLIAGAYMGPAGATGVQSASKGVDKLLDLIPSGEKEKPKSSEGSTPENKEDTAKYQALLRKAGWSDADVDLILSGPPKAAAKPTDAKLVKNKDGVLEHTVTVKT